MELESIRTFPQAITQRQLDETCETRQHQNIDEAAHIDAVLSQGRGLDKHIATECTNYDENHAMKTTCQSEQTSWH